MDRKQVITVVEQNILVKQDIFNFYVKNITCRILNPNADFDLQNAVRHAVQEYLHTPEGAAVYKQNGEYFDWEDFTANVPNEINRNHGFEVVEAAESDIVVNWDEQLAADF